MKRELFTKKEESVPDLKVLENEDLKSVSGGVTLDKHNDVPVNMVNRVFETDKRYSIVQASDPNDLTNTIKLGMQEEIDRLNQEMQNLQTPDGNNGSVYTGIDDYLENASVLKTEGIYDEIDTNMDIDAMNEEIIRQVSAPQMVPTNQNPLDNLKFITANDELPF